MDHSKIEWTDSTWNPVTGCTKVSEGCRHCYAETQAPRTFKGRPFTDVRFHPERLYQPSRWRRPRRVFVNSMSDLFHEDVTTEQLDQIFGVMVQCKRHDFQILTKRPERMRDYIGDPRTPKRVGGRVCGGMLTHPDHFKPVQTWPLPNVWLGVSAENQDAADARIPILLRTPAEVRFVSLEPLIGPVDMTMLRYSGITNINALVGGHGNNPGLRRSARLDWVIVGGESGPKARPCHVFWIRSIVHQCTKNSTPVFVKQLGRNPRFPGNEPMLLGNSKGSDPSEWPVGLHVREMPASFEEYAR